MMNMIWHISIRPMVLIMKKCLQVESAMRPLRKLIMETKAHYILLSYSSGGRATKQELNGIINESGKLLKVVEIDYKKNVMGNMRWTNEWVNGDGKYHEYLFLMEKTNKRNSVWHVNKIGEFSKSAEKIIVPTYTNKILYF